MDATTALPSAWTAHPVRRPGWGRSRRPGARGRTGPRSRTANVVFAAALLAASAAWTVTLRPAALGGPVDYVLVRGVSMVPTFHSGDLVVVRHQASYRVGDVIAYRVPEGDVGAGSIVIHRIIGGSTGSGFDVRGDNNPAPDDWHPRAGNVLGKAWLVLPHGGSILAFLHAPVTLGSLAAGVAVAFMVVPPPARSRRRTKHVGPRRLPR